jgi:outer membrane biosynthesis protein TonB
VVTLYGLIHWHLFDRKIEEETPFVVQLVNLAPETRATQVTRTPPKPEKPAEVAEVEAPKPPEPKPEPPKPQPPPESKPPPAEAAKPPPLPPPPEVKPQEAKAEPKPQPELPKPPERKPEPPKKKEEVMSDELLRNLAKRSPTRTPEEAPKQTAAAPAKASSQPIAPLGPQLTTNELDTIRQQLKPCWLVQAGARDAANLTPEFRVYMNRDGTIRDARQLNPERNSEPYFRSAAEAAARALRNPQCQPLKLPPEKYDQWQTFTIIFDPKDLT